MNKEKNSISVNFLMPNSLGQKTFNMLKFFVLAVFIFNMSLSGVFFVIQDALACHGDITIKKVIDGEQSAQIFNFSGDLGNFSLTGGDSKSFIHKPGHVVYTVTEAETAGWELENIECDSGNTKVNLASSTVTINLQNLDDITCTFINKENPPEPFCGDGNLDAGEECDDGNNINNDGCSAVCDTEAKLIVKKIVVGGEATSSDWTMNIDNGMSFPGDYSGTEKWLAAGSYQISESDYLSGYYTLGYSDDCDSSGNVELSTSTVKTCTLTNTYASICGDGKVDPGEECDDGNKINDDNCSNECEPRGELIVKKIVVGGDATSSDWTMNIANGPSFAGSAEGTANWLDAGMYQVTETPSIPHYNLTYSGDCGSTGNVPVAYNSTSTCVLTNTYVPFCGDYHVDAGEDCDDGPTGSAVCTAECKIVPPECGDGKVDPGEECDDGNKINNDKCNNNCERQGELIIKKIVVGGEATSSDWTMLVGDQLSFPGSYAGVSNWVKVGGYQVGETPDNTHYTLTFSGDCSEAGFASVDYGSSTTCVLTNTYASFCGDYNLDPGEECDDGPTGSAVCTAECETIETGDLKICKYEDEDGSLISQNDQSMVYDWPFVVTYTDQSTSTVRTGEDGCAILSDLPLGIYTVSETLLDGWIIISPESGSASTTVAAGETAELDFYNRRYGDQGMICGYKYEDPDNNPATANTNGLKNWTIELSDTENCALGQEWADSVISYEPGDKNNGNPLDAEDADASKSLGAAEQDNSLNYVSLGFGGTLILKFDNIIMNGAGADIEIFETSSSTATLANNPEQARVYASQSGADGSWVDLGLAILDSSLDLGSLSWAKYIKLVDESDRSRFGPLENGYDLDGIRAPYCRSDWQARTSTVTDDSGHYCFYGLEKGLYRVSEVLKPDWHNTTGLYHDILLDYGNDENYNFNNYYHHEEEHYCGDGILDAGEACDDGNNVSGDGCSATCNTEGGGGGGRTYLKVLDVEAHCIARDAVVVNWRTNKSATSWVVYGTSSNDIADASTIINTSKTTTHSVTINGLTPGVDYYFNPYSSVASDVDHATVSVNTDDCCQVKGEEGEPVLTIKKTVGQDFVNPGEKGVQYTIIVKNTGNLTAFNTILSDLLPAELNYSDLNGKTRNWDLGDIKPGQSKMINYLVDVSPDAHNGFYKNVAEVKADNYPLIKDEADVESREIIVLAETGFSLGEFILLIMALCATVGSAIYLKKRYLKA